MRTILLVPMSAVVIACGGEMEGAPAQGSDAQPGGIPHVATSGSTPDNVEEGEPVVSISARVGGRALQSHHRGECSSAPEASIYGTRAAMWMVAARKAGEIERLRLTAWLPRVGGAGQLNLRLQLSSGVAHEIDTVTGDGETAGSATVTVEPRGEGGRLVVDGRAADGTPLHLTIDCARFAGIEAEGG